MPARGPLRDQSLRREAEHGEQDQPHQQQPEVGGRRQQVLLPEAAGGRAADDSVDMSQVPAGSAITQTYQIRKPPRMAPQLLPEPPTITITQIRKV